MQKKTIITGLAIIVMVIVAGMVNKVSVSNKLPPTFPHVPNPADTCKRRHPTVDDAYQACMKAEMEAYAQAMKQIKAQSQLK